MQQDAPATITSVHGLLSIVATDALAALAGGYVLALVALHAAVQHAIVLGAILLPLGVLSATLNAGQEPFWFQMAVLAALVLALPCGARLRRGVARRGALRAPSPAEAADRLPP